MRVGEFLIVRAIPAVGFGIGRSEDIKHGAGSNGGEGMDVASGCWVKNRGVAGSFENIVRFHHCQSHCKTTLSKSFHSSLLFNIYIHIYKQTHITNVLTLRGIRIGRRNPIVWFDVHCPRQKFAEHRHSWMVVERDHSTRRKEEYTQLPP